MSTETFHQLPGCTVCTSRRLVCLLALSSPSSIMPSTGLGPTSPDLVFFSLENCQDGGYKESRGSQHTEGKG